MIFNKNKIIKFQTVHIELTNNNNKLLLRNQSKFIIFEANKMFLRIKFSVYLNFNALLSKKKAKIVN